LLQKEGDSIREKHVLFAFLDPGIQELFTVNNLSSSLWDGRKKDGNVFLDTFAVIDANIGVNKANYYTRRSVDQRAVIEDGGDIRETATITYVYNSKTDSPFGGNYKNYVRFVLPANAVLDSVIVDNKELSTTPAVSDPTVYMQSNFVPPSGLEIEKTQEQGKMVYGFLIMVPFESTKVVSIRYTVPQVVNTQLSAFAYDLSVFKQPGTDKDPYSFSLSYPTKYSLVKTDELGRDLGGKFVYETSLSEDKDVRLEFSKK
jgi:hypothetical protein